MIPATLDRERLVKLCGMLGSDHAGERANAAAAADKLIREAGMRWSDVLLPPLPSPPRWRIETVADAIAFVLRHDKALTAWEAEFIRSVAAQKYPLSAKQVTIVKRLVIKAERAAAEAQ